MSPTRLYRIVARAEAVTWALLLTGMFLKYVTETTELGVRFGGMLHGVVFIAYCLTTVLLWVDQRWTLGRLALGLLSAIPPFVTIPFERYAERKGLLGDEWRLRAESPTGLLEKPTAWLLRRPAQGLLVGVLAVAGLTGVALIAGPPVG
jgi:integral membrane protein